MSALVLAVALWAGAAGDVEVTVDPVSTRPSAPVAPAGTGQAWSLIGARTLAPGASALEAFAGYPAVSVGFLRGVAPGVNVGARLGFAYGVEGMLREVAPGFKVQGLLRLRLLDAGIVSLGVVFEPGFLYYASFLQGGRAGLTLPVGLRLGLAASSALAVAITVDAPLWVEFGAFGGFNAPILTGGGVEYFITSEFLAFARARLGPTLRTTGRQTEVTFEGSLGVGYRL